MATTTREASADARLLTYLKYISIRNHGIEDSTNSPVGELSSTGSIPSLVVSVRTTNETATLSRHLPESRIAPFDVHPHLPHLKKVAKLATEDPGIDANSVLKPYLYDASHVSGFCR